MLGFLARRLAGGAMLLLALSLLSFFVVRLVPGDTVTAMLGTHYNEADAAALREAHGLDKPVIVQYGLWLAKVIRGDLGTAATGKTVTAEIAQALPVTLELLIISLLIAIFVGMPLGVAAAVNRNGPLDYAAAGLGLVGIAVPGFWLGTMLLLCFALWLGWLPSGRYVPLTVDMAANLRHMVLPGIALGAAVAAVVMRMTRASMVEALQQDYVRTARAKGLSNPHVIFRHALQNALLPVLTVLGIQAGYLIGGSVVIEEVFSLSGVGRLVLRAIGQRDYPLLQACILLIGGGFVLANLLVDLIYAWVDPRVEAATS